MTKIFILTNEKSKTLLNCLRTIDENTDDAKTPYQVILVAKGTIPKEARALCDDVVPGVNLSKPTTCGDINWCYEECLEDEDFFTVFVDDCFPYKGWLETAYKEHEARFNNELALVFMQWEWHAPDRDGNMITRKKNNEIFLAKKAFFEKYAWGYIYDPRFKKYRCTVELLWRLLKNNAPYIHMGIPLIEHRHDIENEGRTFQKRDGVMYGRIMEYRPDLFHPKKESN